MERHRQLEQQDHVDPMAGQKGSIWIDLRFVSTQGAQVGRVFLKAPLISYSKGPFGVRHSDVQFSQSTLDLGDNQPIIMTGSIPAPPDIFGEV